MFNSITKTLKEGKILFVFAMIFQCSNEGPADHREVVSS